MPIGGAQGGCPGVAWRRTLFFALLSCKCCALLPAQLYGSGCVVPQPGLGIKAHSGTSPGGLPALSSLFTNVSVTVSCL